MAREVLTIAGQVIGAYFGPVGAVVGGIIGSTLGAYIDPPDPIRGPKLDDRKVTTSSYGQAVPLLYGAQRIAGNVIWAEDLEEVETEEEVGGKGGPSQSVISYSYFGTFAILCCLGPTRGIRRIWADAVLVYDGSNLGAPPPDFDIAIYDGDEAQLPDPTIEAALGVGNVPAYRGYSYFVVNRMPLERFGNRIPSISIELLGEGDWTTDITDLGSPSSYRRMDAVQRLDGQLVTISRNGAGGPATPTLAVVDPTTGVTSLTVTHSNVEFYFGVLDDVTGAAYVPPTDEVWIYCTNNGKGVAGIARFSASSLSYIGSVVPGEDWPIWSGGVMAYDPVGRQILTHRSSTAVSSFVYATVSLEGYMSAVQAGRFFISQLVTGGSSIALGAAGFFEFAAFRLEATTDSVVAVQSAGEDTRAVWDSTRQRYVVVGATRLWTVSDSLTPTISEQIVSLPAIGAMVDALYDPQLDVISVWGTSSISSGSGQVSFYVLDPETFEVLHSGTHIKPSGIVAVFPSPQNSGVVGIGDTQTYDVNLFGTTVGDCVADLCERAGLTAADYDVSELTQRLRGYIVANQAPARSAIEQLAQIYLFDGVEQDDLLYFRKRGGPAVATITLDELGTGVDAAEPTAREQTRANEQGLPRRCYVVAPDPAMDYQTGTQYAEKLARQAGEDMSVSTAAVLTADEAKRTALALLYDRWAGRWTLPVSLMRRYARLVPTDPIEVNGRRYRIINRLDDSGTYKFELLSDDRDTVNQTALGISAAWQAPAISIQVPTTLVILDSALLRDAEDEPGAYAAGYGIAPYWRGAVLYTSNDEGDTWARVVTIPRPGASVGATTTALGNWNGGNRFDETNKLQVGLNSGTPASTTRLGVLNGGNAIAVEAIIDDVSYWEIVQYRDVTAEADGSYILTGLLRGRRGTEYAMGSHAVGNRVALLDTTSIRNIEIDSAVIGIERPYRAVSVGDTIATTPETDVTLRAERLYPLAPVLLGGGRNAALDVILTWVRRTRVGGEWRDSVDASLGETSEDYIVRIYSDATRTVLKRTITGLSTQTTTYTAAQQTADFGSTQAIVYWDVRQVSAIVGAGHEGQGIT